MPTEAEIGWAAGFIDADGSILISKTKKMGYTHGGLHVPTINAVSVDLHALKKLGEILGGGHYIKVGNGGGNVKAKLQTYYWVATGASALTAAKILLPHLVIKSRQAQIVIDFYEATSWKRGGSRKGHQGGSRPMPDEEFLRRDGLRDEIRGLNARNYLERLPT